MCQEDTATTSANAQQIFTIRTHFVAWDIWKVFWILFFLKKMPHSCLHHPVEDLDEKTKPPLFLSWRTRRLRSSFSPTAVKTTHHHHSSLARRRAPVDHDEHYIAGSIDRHVTVNATVNGRPAQHGDWFQLQPCVVSVSKFIFLMCIDHVFMLSVAS